VGPLPTLKANGTLAFASAGAKALVALHISDMTTSDRILIRLRFVTPSLGLLAVEPKLNFVSRSLQRLRRLG